MTVRSRIEELTLTFPLDKLSTLQRQAWGIRPSATSVVIHLMKDILFHKKFVGFCIHMPPDDGENDNNHRYRPAHTSWTNAKICSGKSNILTYVLDREIHDLLKKTDEPEDVYRKASSIIYSARPGAKCVVCHQPFGERVRLWRPLPCSDDCREIFNGSSIDTRISPLIGDPVALDFLLSCVYQVALNCGPLPSDKRLPGCPIPLNILKTVIESFPALSSETKWDEVLDDDIDEGRNRRKLLSWLSGRFEGFLSSSPRVTGVKGCGNAKQFLLLNSSVSREVTFSKQKGTPKVAFHGTRASHAFGIISDGLKNLSADQNPAYAFRAAGIYVSNQARVSLHEYTSTFTGWKNSQFQSDRIVFGCELVEEGYSNKTPQYQYSFANQAHIMIRYVFLVPESDLPNVPVYGASSDPPLNRKRRFPLGWAQELEKSLRVLHDDDIL